ncbi:MAG TPA: peptide chain release factor N(5)-glutamine methyltransferase [Deltaproteobacteria bacterium]|nr:peptide chain release factor N(5)-glutamine methyltransferase [Deltaproteobacteria bacterium]
MRIKDIVQHSNAIPRQEALSIIAFALSMTKEETISCWERELARDQTLYIQKLLNERAHGKPFSYITKNKEFFSEQFFVDERVLIPRPETELLVEITIDIINKKADPLYIVDVGTGSGAIGIAIAKKTSHRVFCVDVSWDALCVAKKNAMTHSVTGHTQFVCMDVLEGFKKGKCLDVIVANLPYISSDEWASLMVDVKDFEPSVALQGGVDGIEVYRRLCYLLPYHLKENGYIICEVGGKTHEKKVRELFEATGLTVQTRKDLAGIERALIGTWINS